MSLKLTFTRTRFFLGLRTACFPCGTALAATWNKELLEEVGVQMASQAKVKGVQYNCPSTGLDGRGADTISIYSVILAPTINIHRSPLAGRNFESFSEDPFLTGHLAASVVRGIQREGVASTIKHFVCNDQETQRTRIDVLIPQRLDSLLFGLYCSQVLYSIAP